MSRQRRTDWTRLAILLAIGALLVHCCQRSLGAEPTTRPTTRPAANEQPVALYCLDVDLCEYVREACAAAVVTFPGEHPVVVLAFGHRWGDEGNIECPDGRRLSFEDAAETAAIGYPGHPLFLVVFETEYGDQG